jgi:hypothetical protein
VQGPATRIIHKPTTPCIPPSDRSKPWRPKLWFQMLSISPKFRIMIQHDK